MTSSLPLLKDMSQGKSISFTLSDIHTLKRYFERIALILDVCTSDEQMTESYKSKPEYQDVARHRKEPPVLSFADRSAWLDGAPLRDTTVSLGSHDGALGLNPDLSFAHGLVMRHGDAIPHPFKRISIAIRNIVACLDVRPALDDSPPSLRSIDAVLAWPIVPAVSYDDYFSLRHQDSETMTARILFRDNRFVADVERLSRLRGTLTLPVPQHARR